MTMNNDSHYHAALTGGQRDEVREIVDEMATVHIKGHVNCHHQETPQPEPVACHCGSVKSPAIGHCTYCGDIVWSDGMITPNPERAAKSAEPPPFPPPTIEQRCLRCNTLMCIPIPQLVTNPRLYTPAQVDAAVAKAQREWGLRPTLRDHENAEPLGLLPRTDDGMMRPVNLHCYHCGQTATGKLMAYSPAEVHEKIAEAVDAARAEERRIVNEERDANEKKRWEDYHREEHERLTLKLSCITPGTCMWYAIDDEKRLHTGKLTQEPSA
jgi:hypothetical protein